MKVSAIIPAYNEAERIGTVLEALIATEKIDEIIVVDDGSTDRTAAVAKSYGVEVLSLPRNMGKATALDQGVKLTQNDVFLFLDADLVGLRPEHIERMIGAYERRSLYMVIGVFKEGRLNTDISQVIAPYLSGQRVLNRDVWDRVRKGERMDFGVEMALTKLALKEGWEEERVELNGVTHVMKEEKRGFPQGLVDRLKMYGDILRSVFTRVETGGARSRGKSSSEGQQEVGDGDRRR
jgi:glycosyltransferase involved in cell wall biosynthesis